MEPSKRRKTILEKIENFQELILQAAIHDNVHLIELLKAMKSSGLNLVSVEMCKYFVAHSMVDVMEILKKFTSPDLWLDESIWNVAFEVNSMEVVAALVRCSDSEFPEIFGDLSLQTFMDNSVVKREINLEDIDYTIIK